MSEFDKTKNIGKIVASCIQINKDVKENYYGVFNNRFILLTE